MEIIKSKDNKTVKLIKSLNQKKNREEVGLYVVEGLKIVEEALQAAIIIENLVIREDIYDSACCGYEGLEWLWEVIDRNSEKEYRQDNLKKITIFDKELFNSTSFTENPQGIMALIEIPERASKESFVDHKGNKLCILALDEIKDPGNMGTILRTMDAFGIDGIILGRGCVDIYNDKVTRSSMGSIFRLKCFFSDDLSATLNEFKNDKFSIIGTDPHSDTDFTKVKIKDNVIIVIGNESKGISELVRNSLTGTVSIPMIGRAESLNAAIATALVAYEFRKNNF